MSITSSSKLPALIGVSAIIALLALVAFGCGGDEGNDNGTEAPETMTVQCTKPPRERLDPATIVGERLEDASATAEGHGCSLREVIRDGEDLVVTADYVPDRINVETEDGTIIEVTDVG